MPKGGGYHVTQRLYEGKYRKVESLFQVPKVCVSEPDNGCYNGVFPEFVHGFHTTGSTNLDAGLIYSRYGSDGDTWRLFHSGNGVVASGNWEELGTFTLAKSSQVYMTTVISIAENKVITELRWSRNSAPFKSLKTTLNDDFYKNAVTYNNGCKVFRELLMSTNRLGTTYYNTRARFEFAKFTFDILTDINGIEHVMDNSGEIKASADNDVVILTHVIEIS